MIRLLRFSPSRLALGYIALSAVALALLAAPLWYAWRINIGTFKAYVQGEDVQRLVDVFHREGATGLVAAMESEAGNPPGDNLMILADRSKSRLAGNLPAWPPQVPDAPGTYGLVIDIGGGATMRVVASHVVLPGGYHLLMGRESVRFRSLVEFFWYGIAGAAAIVLVLAAVIGWLIHRALLAEVAEISRTASAIADGDLSRRLATASSGSPELDALARTVNGMLAQLASKNAQLESEIGVRRKAEQALHLVHEQLEGVVAQRTEELARANESLRRSEERYARTIDASDEGQWDVNLATGEIFVSARMKEIFGFAADARIREHADYVARAPFHPDDRQRVLDAFQALVAGAAERYEIDYRVVPRPGEVRWVRSRAKAFRDGRGIATRISGSLTDITDRKLAAEALRENEARFRSLTELSSDWYWEQDENLRFTYVSSRIRDLTGDAGESSIGKTRWELPSMTPLSGSWAEHQAVLAAREPFRDFECSRLGPDGTTRYVSISGTPIFDEQGRFKGYRGIGRNITERKKVEKSLKQSELRFRQLFENSIDALFVHDERGRFVDCNAAACQALGYTREELLHLSVADIAARLLSDEERRERKGETLWQRAMKSEPGRIVGFEENDLRRKDGSTFPVEVGVGAIEYDGRRLIYASVRETTERKRAEAELRSRQEMLDLAQKSARAAAFEWRIAAGEGQNPSSPDLEAMYGLAPGAYDGTFEALKRLVHPEDWPAVTAAMARANESGDVAAEYRVVHPGGAVRWLQAKGRIFRDDRGRPARVVGFMLDVTERRQAEEELRRLEARLRQAQRLEAMGTLAGGIAHDFNNILGAILGYGERASAAAPRGSRLHRDLESVLAAGERGRALVDRVLAFSRSGMGERIAVHVEGVVREALDLIAAKLPPGIAIETALKAGRAAMHGDPTQVHQVLVNLATNAIQAMPAGGTLRVSLNTERVDAARVATIGTIGVADYLVLEVADTGTGIPPQILDRIFDPFFTTKEVNVGTGLGLSLVHGIVMELGGAIDLATTAGAGSTFTVYLPRAGDAPDHPEDTEPAVPQGGGQRVLFVDDEEPLVRLATETLEELGYAPVGFTSSAAALEAFRADPKGFDAVITDERMPGMSGSALIRAVRGIRRSVPIVLVSGYAGGMVATRAHSAGADEVLKKPLSARELAASLARVLQV